MAEINFYHLTRLPIRQALPRLLEKVLNSKQRAIVKAGNAGDAEVINQELWSSTRIFIPHGTKEDGFSSEQPIYITHEEENPNQAKVLVALAGAPLGNMAAFDKTLVMFDGNEPYQVKEARSLWKTLRDEGHALVYWQQDQAGKWQKAA